MYKASISTRFISLCTATVDQSVSGCAPRRVGASVGSKLATLQHYKTCLQPAHCQPTLYITRISHRSPHVPAHIKQVPRVANLQTLE